jgi:hypothetical protein
MAIFTMNVAALVNLPPSIIGDNTINIPDADTDYVFTLDDFTTGTNPQYVDPEDDALEAVKITTLESSGDLLLSGAPVTLNQEISSADIVAGNLTYDATAGGDYTATFQFDISDVGSNTFSGLTPGIMTLEVAADANQPPSNVGDGSTNVPYGQTITFTRAMLTTETIPPYADPEGDDAFKLKILSLPLLGLLLINGTEVSVNQVILFSDIDLELLTYVPDLDDKDGDVQPFSFAIADEVSGIFVE